MADAPTSWSSSASPATAREAAAPPPLANVSAKPIAPPPLPSRPVAARPEPLGYKSQQPAASGSFAPLAARLSWLAPIVAIVFLVVAGGVGETEPVARIIGVVGMLILLAGIALGIIALANVRRAGRDGVLGPAIVGLSVNFLLLAAIGTVSVIYVRAQQAQSAMIASAFAQAAAAQASSSSSSQIGKLAPSVPPPATPSPGEMTSPARAAPETPATPPSPAVVVAPPAPGDTLVRLPGWIGASDRTDLRIVVMQWHDDSPARQKLKELYEADSTMVTVVINNSVGGSQVTIDPASLEFHFNDYTTLKALPPKQILQTARSDREYYLKRYGGDWNVPPRQIRTDGLAFFPPSTDLSNARAVTMTLNGQRIVVPGKYCSAEEKAQIMEVLQVGQ